jgi:UDP-glucose 4-epimerase
VNNFKKTILVVGGAGYIGRHTVVELYISGYEVIVLDNFCNSKRGVFEKIIPITGRETPFIEGDVRDKGTLDEIFLKNNIYAVIHFSGLKSISESLERPLEYYDNNVSGTTTLCLAMQKANVKKLIFSSSATVYGVPNEVPISELNKTGEQTNPYGRSKLIAENIMQDLAESDSDWSIALLRYFNPIGVHSLGLIGEEINPTTPPANLMPYIAGVAIGTYEHLDVYGGDYPTKDGTGVRDYIHVVDLAKGHVKALDYLDRSKGIGIWNMGTGKGYSVFEMVREFENISGIKIPFKIRPRRSGDVAECWSNPEKAKKELQWEANYTLNDMMRHTWDWIKESH